MGGEMQGTAGVPGRAAAESLIQWWREAGVDGAVGEDPRDWLRRNAAPAPAAPVPAALTDKPANLADFQTWLAAAQQLPMNRPGAIRVAPHGGAAAKVMLLSDLPDRDDAADGMPIGGEAWQLAQRML